MIVQKSSRPEQGPSLCTLGYKPITSKHHFCLRFNLYIRQRSIKGTFVVTLLHFLHSIIACTIFFFCTACFIYNEVDSSFLCWITESILMAPFHPRTKKRNNKQQVIYLCGQNDLMLLLVDRLIWPELPSIDKTLKECHSSTT